MEINRNMHVSLTYELRTGGFEGELKEKAVEETPLAFVYGAGLMMPKFEEHILGLKKGDNYKFEIKSDDAYGPAFEDRIVDLPKNIFEVDGKIDESLLVLGNTVPMMDAQGNRMNGMVKELKEETVTMDFNHPLAGADLCFQGSVLDVREASEQELLEASGALSGGCGCGSGGGCGDGSCGDGGCGSGEEVEAGCGSGCGCH